MIVPDTGLVDQQGRPVGEKTGFLPWLDTHIGRNRGRIEILHFLCVIIGVPLLLLQLLMDAHHRKVDQTLSFAARLNNEWLGPKRSDLVRPWFDYREDIKSLSQQKGGAEGEVIDSLVREIVRTHSEREPDRDLNLAIYEMADFFDQLKICIDAGLCNESAARDYFGSFAKDFFCLYGVIIRDLRRDLSMETFGAGLEAFVDPKACYAKPAEPAG